MTKQLQFLETPDNYHTSNPNQADVSLSDYNLSKVKKIKGLSPLRWVKGVDLHLSPGKGSGCIIIGEHTFNVVYAWGGRNRPDGGWNARTSYTVRLEGDGVKEILNGITRRIIIDEFGSLTYQVPFREHQKRMGNTSARTLRRSLTECNEYFKKNPLKSFKDMKPIDVEASVESFKKDWKENKPVTLYRVCSKIETDTLR